MEVVNPGYVLKAEQKGIVNRSNMGWESRSQGCLWSFGLEHLLFTEMAK
jgi:hypothetical protein